MIRNIPVPHAQRAWQTGHHPSTHTYPHTRIHTCTRARTPSFKVEVEGLLELVACDCVLMKEWLQRGDKEASLGWEVLGGIRIIIKKSHVFKNTQWTRASPAILHSFLHPSILPPTTPVGQLTDSSVMACYLQGNVTFPLVALCSEPNVRFKRLERDNEKMWRWG